MEGFKLELAVSVKLLGLTIDQNWTLYDKDISNICKVVSAKFKSLSRIRNALDKKQAKLLYIFLDLSQFDYFSILLMFYSKKIIEIVK